MTPAKQQPTTSHEIDTEIEAKLTPNLHQRLAFCIRDVGAVVKDGSVTDRGGRPMYSYQSHEAVTMACRRVFVIHGVLAVPTVTSWKQNGNTTEVDVRVTFFNVDDPSESLVVDVFGYGCDPSDKGPGKAMSYAVKYAMLKVLMLPTQDDIEVDDFQREAARKPTCPLPLLDVFHRFRLVAEQAAPHLSERDDDDIWALVQRRADDLGVKATEEFIEKMMTDMEAKMQNA